MISINFQYDSLLLLRSHPRIQHSHRITGAISNQTTWTPIGALCGAIAGHRGV